MKVKFLVPVVGPDIAYAPGEIVELQEEEAAKWADGIRAEVVIEEDAEVKKSKRAK